MPRYDAASSVFKYRNAWEFRDAGFRLKHGMTMKVVFFIS